MNPWADSAHCWSARPFKVFPSGRLCWGFFFFTPPALHQPLWFSFLQNTEPLFCSATLPSPPPPCSCTNISRLSGRSVPPPPKWVTLCWLGTLTHFILTSLQDLLRQQHLETVYKKTKPPLRCPTSTWNLWNSAFSCFSGRFCNIGGGIQSQLTGLWGLMANWWMRLSLRDSSLPAPRAWPRSRKDVNANMSGEMCHVVLHHPFRFSSDRMGWTFILLCGSEWAWWGGGGSPRRLKSVENSKNRRKGATPARHLSCCRCNGRKQIRG